MKEGMIGREGPEDSAVVRHDKLLVDERAGLSRFGVERDLQEFQPTYTDIGALLISDEGGVLAGTQLVVLGQELMDGTPVVTAARRLVAAHPNMGIFVVATDSECPRTLFLLLSNSGVDDVFLTDRIGERERLLDHVRRRLDAPLPAEALRLIGRSRAGTDPVAMWLLRNAYRNPSIDEAGAHFARHRSSVWRHLRGVGLPEPGTLLRCGRVLHALHLLGEMALTHSEVAERFGMESETGVRMLLRRAKHDEAVAAAFVQLGLQQPKT